MIIRAGTSSLCTTRRTTDGGEKGYGSYARRRARDRRDLDRDLLELLDRADRRTRRTGRVRRIRSRPLVLVPKWRYTLLGWLMWRLWKRRFRRKLQLPRR